MTLSGNTIAAENGGALRHSLSGDRYGESISNIHRMPSDWMRAIEVLSKEWRTSALFAIVVVAIVTCVTFVMKPVYESEGRLQIDPPGSEVFSLDAAGAGLIDSEYINT